MTKQELFDNKVSKVMPMHIGNVYDKRMKAVEGYIDLFSVHPFSGSEVGTVLDDVVSTRGKMIRPRLLLLAGEFGSACKTAQDRLCKLAAIVEMTHMASLIHDDIVDDSDYRRGKPSIQKKYGKDAAVYAGDFLMGRISYYMMKEAMNRAGIVLSKTIEAMCAGEIGQAMCRYKENVTVEEYLNNIHGKTVALFMACCRIGAMESGCDERLVRNLELFGECLGLMFQIRDDLLDFTSDVLTIGKSAHKDFQEGIYTMPILCAMKQPGGRETLIPFMRRNAEGALTLQEMFQMETAVTRLGGVEAAWQEVKKLQSQAEAIADELPQCEYSRLLLKLVRKLGTV